MTVKEHLEYRLRDIESKAVCNGLTAGLVVQKREVLKRLQNLSVEDGAKEYKPETPPKSNSFTINGFGHDYQ